MTLIHSKVKGGYHVMQEKLYKCGLVLGRFCHEHLEHELLINASMYLAEHTLVLVGSAQESGTLRNPFDIDTRINVIKTAHSYLPENALTVKGINDLKNEYNNDYSWGDFVKSEVESHMGKFVDLIVYGNDPVKRTWFRPEDIYGTAEHFIPRGEQSLSSTLIRALLTIDDRYAWEKATSPNIHGMYDELRSKLLEVPVYDEIYKEIKHNPTLENFMNVYNDFAEIDKKKKFSALK
jgi:nicotinamide-nucleotide adenylyltransferase